MSTISSSFILARQMEKNKANNTQKNAKKDKEALQSKKIHDKMMKDAK